MVELSLERSQHCDRDGQSAVGVIPLQATNAFNRILEEGILCGIWKATLDVVETYG